MNIMEYDDTQTPIGEPEESISNEELMAQKIEEKKSIDEIKKDIKETKFLLNTLNSNIQALLYKGGE